MGNVFKKLLENKNISILGDSISTFIGISNNTEDNKTLGVNAVCYDGKEYIFNVNETWWMQVINRTGARLCVNNSFSGGTIFLYPESDGGASYKRCLNLHNEKLVIKPDLLFYYIGVNDINNRCFVGDFNSLADIIDDKTGEQKVIDSFAKAYALGIYNAKKKYNCDIFCFTIPLNGITSDEKIIKPYNDQIIKISRYFDCLIVDLFKAYGNEFSKYCLDKEILHPCKLGHSYIADTVIEVLESCYK